MVGYEGERGRKMRKMKKKKKKKKRSRKKGIGRRRRFAPSSFSPHLSRDVQLLLGRQRGSRALLSVPQRRVEDADVVGVGDAARDVVGAGEALFAFVAAAVGRRCGSSDDDGCAAIAAPAADLRRH